MLDLNQTVTTDFICSDQMLTDRLVSGLSYLRMQDRYILSYILNTEEFLFVEIEGSEEEDKENDKAEEIPNESVLDNKVSGYSFNSLTYLLD